MSDSIRPLLSGDHFFPSRPQEFQALLPPFEEVPPLKLGTPPLGLLLPHGAATYTLASALPLVRTLGAHIAAGILLLGTVHREFSRRLWFPPYAGLSTPFGVAPIPVGLVADLAARFGTARVDPLPFEEEPCFDLIISLLTGGGYRGPILPILIGSPAPEPTPDLADLVRLIVEERGFFPIVSANYSLGHEGEEPAALCGEALKTSLDGLFRRARFRWYYGHTRADGDEPPCYPSGYWC